MGVRLTPEQRAQCVALRERGFIFSRIANIVGVSDVAARRVCREAGILPENPGRPARELAPDAASAYVSPGQFDVSYDDMARELGIARSAVINHERSAIAKLRKLLAEAGYTAEDFFR